MTKAEQFYRSKYPKVGHLTLMHKEIINLLEEYETSEKPALNIGDVSNPVCGFVSTGYRPPCYMDKSHTCQNCEHKRTN